MNIIYKRRTKRQRSIRITDFTKAYLEEQRKKTRRYIIWIFSRGHGTLTTSTKYYEIVNLTKIAIYMAIFRSC